MPVYKRILVAVDLSPDALFIGQRARALAAALEGELEVIHVVAPLIVPMRPDAAVPAMVTTQAVLVERAEKYIDNLVKELGVPETPWSVVVGNTRDEIIRVATDRAVELIVIGTRERHALAFLIKPTEDAVIHRAPCDVLAVRLN